MKNESGEFELVVGNRQLLSGFFIVVLLLAVTFAMGYVVGQNSPRTAKAQTETPSSPLVPAEGRPQPVTAPPPTPPAAPAGDQPPDAAAQPSTQPARDSAASVPAAPPPEQPAPAPSAASQSTAVQEAPPGSYWQVMAVNQPAAEAVLKTLRDNGFPALLSPGPNNLVRVLVGPYNNDLQAMSKAKTELEKLGLHPVRK